MKRFLLLLILPFCAQADYHPDIQFGVATTIEFVLYNTDGTLDVDEVDAGTEVTVHCDGDAGTAATNDFVDEGSYYSIALTAAETECARITLDIAATDRNVVFIRTFGSVRAFDKTKGVASGTAAAVTATTLDMDTTEGFADDELNEHTVCVTNATLGEGQCTGVTDSAATNDRLTVDTWTTTPTGTVEYYVHANSQANVSVDANSRIAADAQCISGDCTAADNLESDYDGTGYDKSASTIGTLTSVAAGGITATSIAADAIGSSELAATAVTEIVDAIGVDVADDSDGGGDSIDWNCARALMLAYTAGPWSNGGTGNRTTTYQDPFGGETRIIVTRAVDGESLTVDSWVCPDGTTGP